MKLINRIIVLFLFPFSIVFSQTAYEHFTHPYAETESHHNSFKYKFNIVQTDKISSQHYSLLNLTGQALVGSTLAIGFSILPFSASFGYAWGGKSNPAAELFLGVLTISSYLLGAAVGVHWIASYENPNLSTWGTAGYSAIGGACGALIAAILAANYTTVPAPGVIVVLLTPVIGSMIYASFVADWPDESKQMSFHKINLSHKDLIELAKVINLELLRINL